MKKFTILLGICLIIFAMAINAAPKKVFLVEEHTGAWCPPCGSVGKPVMEALIEKYPEDVISVELHNASSGRVDPMAIPEQQTVAAAMGLTGFPYGTIDRIYFTSAKTAFIYPTQWDGIITQLLGMDPVVDVKLYYSLDRGTRKLTATVEAEFLEDVTPAASGELRFNVYILEDDIVYNQAGNIKNFHHMNVCRKMLGGAWGTSGIIPSSALNGGTYSYTYNFDLEPSWNLDNLHFVGVVQEYHQQYVDVKKILNSVRGIEGAPTPPTSEITTSDSEIKVISLGEACERVFTLKNVSEDEITFKIDAVPSERTPSDWSKVVIIGEDETNEVTLAAGATTNITLQLTPSETLGIGDFSMTVFNKNDSKGQKSKGSLTTISKEIRHFQVSDGPDMDLYSISSYLIANGYDDFYDIGADEYSEVAGKLTNVNILIWNCCEKGEITEEDAFAIETALDNGVNLFMIGGNMSNKIRNNAYSLMTRLGFSYEGVCMQGYSTSVVQLQGFDNDPISDGFNEECKLIAQLTPSLEMKNENTFPILKHRTNDTIVACRTVLENSKAIYLGINPYIITNTVRRRAFIGKSMDWLAGVGPAISCVDKIEFEDAEIGEISNFDLTIENTGNSDLIIDEFEFDYEYAVIFKLAKSFTSLTISPGESKDIAISFAPFYAIEYDTWLKVHSNSVDNPIWEISLSGSGINAVAGPKITLSTNELVFPETYIGNPAQSLTFDIENPGSETLEITSIAVPIEFADVYTIEPTTISIESAGKEQITVNFEPTEEGDFSTVISIESNASEIARTIDISASAVVGVDDYIQANKLISLKAGPNPFNNITTIEFTLNSSRAMNLKIAIIDASGREIESIVNDLYESGSYSEIFDASKLSSGTFYIVASTKDYSAQIPIVLVK